MGYGMDEIWLPDEDESADFMAMLEYFGIDVQYWQRMSGNDKRQHWWNYWNVGPGKNTKKRRRA